MNRQTLAEATSLHDGPVPTYLMEEIANATKASARDAEKVADFLVGRLNKSNLNVKLKALQLISYCIREGGPAFASAVREDEQEIAAYLQYTGPPDPVYGDEKYRRIRVASQEALVCLNDGFLSRSVREERPPPVGGNSWQSPAPAASSGASGDRYDSGPSPYNPNQSRQGGPWGPGGSGSNWPQESSHQGPSSTSFRPPPYQDSPSQYGGNQPSGGYNGPSGGPDNYGYGDNRNNGSNGSYGYNDNSGSQGGYPSQHHQQQQQPSGFDSWSTPAGAGGPSKTTGAGTWSSSGYQKNDPSATSEPRYNATSRRDNRPTVLVGHSLSFARPGAGSTYNPNVGGYNPNAGGYNPNAGNYNPNAGGFNSNSGGYNPNAGRSNSIGGGGGGFGGSSGFGSSSNNSRPNFVENTSRIMSGMNHMGFPTNTQPFNSAPASKLSKRVEVLKRIGNEAREKWDRRNMDKSMASSLADHDELRAGPQVMDHGHYQPTPPQVGAGDASRNYERGMIDNLCASAGLSRAPPADALKRFVDLAQTLDSQTIGDILLDKLEDPTWQVRLKGLHVVLALLESPGAEPYAVWFEDNIEVLEELRKDPKPSVVAKVRQVLQVLGVEVEQQPVVRRQASGGRAASQRSSSPAPRAQNDVDFLGFESLSIQQQPAAATAPAPAAPAPVAQAPPAELDIFGSPHGGPAQPPPALVPPSAQEVSLLDGFDPVGSTSSVQSYGSAPPQQFQQQQYQQQSQQHDQQQYEEQQYQQQQQQQYQQQQQQQYQQQEQQQQQYQQQQYQQQQYQQQQHQYQQDQYAPDAGLLPDQVTPEDARAKTLSHFGKDLFTIANSPRAAAASPPLDDGSGTPGAGQSAFNFM